MIEACRSLLQHSCRGFATSAANSATCRNVMFILFSPLQGEPGESGEPGLPGEVGLPVSMLQGGFALMEKSFSSVVSPEELVEGVSGRNGCGWDCRDSSMSLVWVSGDTSPCYWVFIVNRLVIEYGLPTTEQHEHHLIFVGRD